MDQHDDLVIALARAVNYFPFEGEEYQYRIFPWTIGFNPNEETTMVVVWISLPNLSPELFARKSLLSIASIVGKPIAIDKATYVKSRPSTARVRVIVDLVAKLPQRIRLQHSDNESGKIVEVFQEVDYEYLPGYCNVCKHQGHVDSACRVLKKKNTMVAVAGEDSNDQSNIEKLQYDARDYLNAKLLQKQVEEVPVDRALGAVVKNLPIIPGTDLGNNSHVDPTSSRTDVRGDRMSVQQGASVRGVGLAENNGGNSLVNGPQSSDANVTERAVVAVTGRNSVSGAIFPIAEAIARVSQDLKGANYIETDRGLAGVSKASVIEPVHS